MQQSSCLHQMLKISSFGVDTFTQSITPLIHCSVDNVLIKVTPLFFNQSFLSDDRRQPVKEEVD